MLFRILNQDIMLTHAWDCWIIQNSGCICHSFWWSEIIVPRNPTFWPDMPGMKIPRKHLLHMEICKASSCTRSVCIDCSSDHHLKSMGALLLASVNKIQSTKKTLEMPYSDIVCPPSGLWSIGGSFFGAQEVFGELQEWNLVLFWVHRNVLSPSSTH